MPGFKLKDLYGKSFSYPDRQGKDVLVVVFLAARQKQSGQSMEDMGYLIEQFKSDPVKFVGVTINTGDVEYFLWTGCRTRILQG